jgi:hypothetical protein
MTPAATIRERTAVHESGHVVAALALGVPIISVSIDADIPHLHRARYQPHHDAGLECMATLCLAGPAAEEYFCGSIEDGADRTDIEMAQRYLAQRLEPVQIAAEMMRLRGSAERLVRTEWARRRIALITDALLARGTLSGADIDAIGQHRAGLRTASSIRGTGTAHGQKPSSFS